ncbi:MAG TPA: DUF4382 domain-containing protein [Steroidobacteraceae bacterium]|jgi:hypothetical protein|nr:DUF4382 domain-containing protein [Steroidobacteraceae bacterium]
MSIDRAIRTPSGIRRSLALWTLCALGAMGLTACGGSGSSSSSGSADAGSPGTSVAQQPCSNCGTAMLSLTDQPGDFVSYIVNVDSLTLTRSDGTVVQTVPVTTQVDFAQLVNLSEIVSADQIPAGTYASATLTLDYTNATIVVDTGSGDVTVPAADILSGTTGQPLTGQVTVTLTLSSDQRLVVTAGTVANLALDFNLLASNTVDLTATPITVTVNPTLTASLTPDTTKQIHVRGPLVSVSSSANDYVINVRPFTDQSDTTGQVTIATTASTTYLINGMSYTGSAGLAQLAMIAAGTLTSTYGTWDRAAGTLTATQVLIGPSVEGSTMSSVAGTVLARSGDTLTVGNGLLYQPESMGLTFQRQVSVTVGSGTTVVEEGQPGPFTANDISVGQNVRMVGTAGSSSSTPTLDATAGSAFLFPTTGLGLVTTTATGSVSVGLQQLGNVDASQLNFAGTGATSQQDATASSYQVSVPSSVSTSEGSGAAVEFTGFVTPFGSAPPDFAASTLVIYGQTHTLFDVRWASPGITAPFMTLNASGLLLGQTTLQASAQKVIRVGWLTLDPTALSAGLDLVPDTTGTAQQSFAIVHVQSHTIDSFSTFNDLATALATDLNGTTGVLQVMAEGSYSGGALTADHMIVALNN